MVRECLKAQEDPAAALLAVDRVADDVPGSNAATCCIVVLDPATGRAVHSSAGHPAPLAVAPAGTTRYLAPAVGAGPLGTGATYLDTEDHIPEGSMLLLYTDGIIEHPTVTPEEGRTALAATVADAALGRAFQGSSQEVVQRTLEQSLELLLRDGGHSDDITLLAAHRTPRVPDFEVVMPAQVDSVRAIQYEFGCWLLALGCRSEDESALQHAVVELVTNAVDHAYRDVEAPHGRREVVVRAKLAADGTVRVEVADHGLWSGGDQPDPFRGRGLSMVEMFTDTFTIDHGGETVEEGVQGTGTGPGTTVRISRRMRRPVAVTEGPRPSRPQARNLTVEADPDTPHLLLVHGTVDTTTVERLTDHLMATSHGGTLPLTLDLTGVTHLASAGVQALHRATATFAGHGQTLTLHTSPHSVAADVLDLAALPHTSRGTDGRAPGAQPGEQ